MLFSVGDFVVETKKWESRVEMMQSLEECNSGFLLLNGDPEYKADSYSTDIYLNYSARDFISFREVEKFRFGIGFSNEIPGAEPTLVWLPPRQIAFGFDCEVVGIRLDKGEVSFRHTFDTPFNSFVLLDELQMLLVFYEIGIIALEQNGTEIWKYERDLISDCSIKSNVLTLVFLDSPSVKIDLLTGNSISY
jgi:hypothetical protein